VLATMAPTVHSAVAASCAPRALQRVMPAGTWPTTCSAPADRSWMTFSLGSLVIASSRAGFEPMGRTMNSTSSFVPGRSPPVHTSASMPSGRGCSDATVSGGSGSHTRVTSPPPGSSLGPLSWARCLPAASLEAELGAPAVRYQVRVFGVLADPGADVRAEGQHGQVPLPSVVETVPGQVGGQPGALEPGIDLRVDQGDLLAAQVVHDETRELAADVQLVPGLRGVVGDNRAGVRRVPGGVRYRHAPAGTGAPAPTGSSCATLITTTGHGARRRHARITGPGDHPAPGMSPAVPSTSMSAPAQLSSSTRAASPSATSVRTSTPSASSGSTDFHMMSVSTSPG